MKCNSNGTWSMSKGSQGCQGLPSLTSGSAFLYSDTNILMLSKAKIFNKSTLAQHTGTLTKTILANSIAANFSDIDAKCLDGYTEYDESGIDVGKPGVFPTVHYYKCVNGNWVARGGCRKK